MAWVFNFSEINSTARFLIKIPLPINSSYTSICTRSYECHLWVHMEWHLVEHNKLQLMETIDSYLFKYYEISHFEVEIKNYNDGDSGGGDDDDDYHYYYYFYFSWYHSSYINFTPQTPHPPGIAVVPFIIFSFYCYYDCCSYYFIFIVILFIMIVAFTYYSYYFFILVQFIFVLL